MFRGPPDLEDAEDMGECIKGSFVMSKGNGKSLEKQVKSHFLPYLFDAEYHVIWDRGPAFGGKQLD